MMFEEEDLTQTTAQDVYGSVATFLKTAAGNNDYEISQWYKEQAYLASQLLRANSIYFKFENKSTQEWENVHKQLDTIITKVENDFIPQLQTWVVEKYPEIEPTERDSSAEDIQWAITSILGFSTSWGPCLQPHFEHRTFTFNDTGKNEIPLLLPKLQQLSTLAYRCVDIMTSTGHFWEQWSRWFIITVYTFLAGDQVSESACRDATFPRHHPSKTLSVPFVQLTLQQYATNPIAIGYFVRDQIMVYLRGLLWSDIKYIMQFPEQTAEVRPFAMKNLMVVMDVLDHFVSMYTNVHYDVFPEFVKLSTHIAWFTGFYSCNAIKAKEMNYPYDQFASRLAEYILWCVRCADTNAYRAANINHLENNWKEINVFERQICLSKKSIEFIQPVYDYLINLDGISQLKPLLTEPKALKPKLPDLIALPQKKDVESWSNTRISGKSDNDDGMNKKIKTYISNVASNIPIEPETWCRAVEVESPMNLFQHQNKKSVDASKIYGKIQYVTGGLYDYRVKIVNSGDADANIKIITTNKSSYSPGEWKIVNAFPDYKIKIVTTGTFDFSVKM